MRIVYINLDRAHTRRALIEHQAAELHLTVERFRAIEPETLSVEELERLNNGWERPLKPTEIALFASHRALWRQIANTGEAALILEDDVFFNIDIKEGLKRLPPGYDLINLEHFGRRKFYRRGEQTRRGTFVFHGVARDRAGAAGYWLGPSGARKLLALAEKRAAPADAFLYSAVRLRIAQIDPPLFKQAWQLADLGLDVAIDVSSQLEHQRTPLRLTTANRRFYLRRIRTALRLAGLHLRRPIDIDLRTPAFDPAPFQPMLQSWRART